MLREATFKMLKFAGDHTSVGRRIASGIRNGKIDRMFTFQEVESGKMKIADSFLQNIERRGVGIAQNLINNSSFISSLKRFAQKNEILNVDFANMTKEEILETVLQKSGVGPCKFAQIISSEKSIMRKLTPELQTIIRKTQSENPFSRTLEDAQEIVNNAFNSIQKRITDSAFAVQTQSGYKLIKALSAGTVGEAYLAVDSAGKEVIVKMIKKGVDAEQLQLEENIFSTLIREMAPDKMTSDRIIDTLKNLYRSWSKELNFSSEYDYNKLLQQGAKRFKVADILHISSDKSCIIMEKAEGVQMNDLMKMLKLYKANPDQYYSQYVDVIERNPWLKNPEKVIKELPESITKAFDEMFLFMKKDGTSIMHGDPHMGNYFITTSKEGTLLPVYIDTGCCIRRNSSQIKQDIQFLSNYFVGNAKGVAEYFLSMCEGGPANRFVESSKLLTASNDTRKELVEKLAKDIQENIFGKRHNVTDVDAVQKTIQNIMERYGLTISPDASTALKAQMQFYTGITEAASLSGQTINVGTIIRDIPQALSHMLKAKFNPVPTVSPAVGFSYFHQEQTSRIVTQFLSEQPEFMQTLSEAGNTKKASQVLRFFA